MATSYTAAQVMDTASALLNDTAQQRTSYTVQLPYIKKAFRELRQLLQANNVPVGNLVAELLNIAVGTTEITYLTTPALPANLVQIRQLWERPTGIDPWTPMVRRETLPYSLDGASTANFMIWSWQGNAIKLLETTQINDLKIDYTDQLDQIVDQNSVITVINGETFLENQTAGHLAKFVFEDGERATDLYNMATEALDTLNIIESKGKQAILTRRRPFRQSWKTRGSGIR